ncbi:prepilin-type N-terminal cleavage/methylation domain-containing protein [Acinetobacter sp. VNH17]|uniref:Prepilin-type N-terminal cleavage/methylation domain-containing protein n=1 Tax=Acinetobacter thutiue TaxID=2998078 RepID=A0ABT7WPA3_9GAMM|nr:prepilin-type N-terminal cleavage/methylation domain-containing protein [Acinetobacter thutiue]MCY6412394.1 prepilin-type N-terminal cleavage/methylation domain-containing protein [Acinetobacter thutiue]MDN0014498.1 prepilin-type N-terminal cleavage/methylation domain-containing protein [Acinetobacter thutiue]
MGKNRGFTLIELMVTIVIITIVAIMAAPSFSKIINRKQLGDDAQDLVNKLAELRSDAILRQNDKSLSLDPSTSGAWKPKGKVKWGTGQPAATTLTYNMMGRLSLTNNLCFILTHDSDATLKAIILVRKNGMAIYDKSLNACPSNLGNE